jgi:hypothetical protein
MTTLDYLPRKLKAIDRNQVDGSVKDLRIGQEPTGATWSNVLSLLLAVSLLYDGSRVFL